MSVSTSSSSEAAPMHPGIFPMHVLGAGSIGLLYASAMHRAYDKLRAADFDSPDEDGTPPPVTLLMRSHHQPHLRRRWWHGQTSRLFAPVVVSSPSRDNGNRDADIECDVPVELIDEPSCSHDGARGPPIQCLLLCTKATDAVAALDNIWERLISPRSSPKPAKVIILSNGALAIRDAINDHFSDDIAGRKDGAAADRAVQIVLATTTHGAYRTSQSTSASGGSIGHYTITHAGLGSTHCTDADFVHACQSIGWQGEVLSDLDMHVMLWRKLAVNCVINPLTAIHGVKNGQLINTEHLGQDISVVTRHLLEEVSRVALMSMESHFESAKSSMAGTESNNDAPLYALREQLSVSDMEAFVFKVMSDTAENVSSMLQDVKANRATEVKALNGYVASLGAAKYGVQCPWNAEMCRLVEDLKH